jgi:hypothetical protein
MKKHNSLLNGGWGLGFAIPSASLFLESPYTFTEWEFHRKCSGKGIFIVVEPAKGN